MRSTISTGVRTGKLRSLTQCLIKLLFLPVHIAPSYRSHMMSDAMGDGEPRASARANFCARTHRVRKKEKPNQARLEALDVVL